MVAIFLIAGLAQAHEGEQPPMKRRQQGILTGMPFMANLRLVRSSMTWGERST